jgi:predicted hydrolase (HD superfamily)
LAATNVAAKNIKLLQNVIFAVKKLSKHVVGINAVAKSFARTINIAAITNVLQQQLMILA